jgi:hypothetical protein
MDISSHGGPFGGASKKYYKKYAMGTITSGTSSESWVSRNGAASTTGAFMTPVTVTGLKFKPTRIVLYQPNAVYQGCTVYDEAFNFYGVANCDVCVSSNNGDSTINETILVDVGPTVNADVTATGFKLPIMTGITGQTVYWEAYA